MNKDNLSYGLNSRTTTTTTPATRKKKGLTGFDSDSSTDDENRNASTGRSATNKAIVAEQHALRKRAEAALSAEYDYDGEYESFTKNKKPEKKKEVVEKSSRYISNLLQSAQRRTQEQEIIYERKIAREQELEDAEMQYDGKQKFITSAYKRKLAEREEWIRAEKEREERERDEDVTKKTAGSFLFAGFGRNVLSGGVKNNGKDEKFDALESKDKKSDESEFRRSDTSRETEHVGHVSQVRGSRNADSHHSSHPQNSVNGSINAEPACLGVKNDQIEIVPLKTRTQILEERAKKLREAKERYFQRKGLPLSQ